MKKLSKILGISFMVLIGIIFIQDNCFADDYVENNLRTKYIKESFCYLEIEDDGEAIIDVFCRARYNKTIYGKIIIQRKRNSAWTHVKTISVTGYNGRLDKERYYKLSKSGTYRVKFKTTCGGETYTVYSTKEEY